MTTIAGYWFEPFDACMFELSKPSTDWGKYLSLIEAGARAGDDRAMYALGSLMLSGSTEPAVARDRRTGLMYVRRATRSVAAAMLEYAAMLEDGARGVPAAPAAAFALFKKAERFGSITGRFHVARCLLAGTGTKVDRAAAARRLRRCLELGGPDLDAVRECLEVATRDATRATAAKKRKV